ncbi:MAG: antibiotic biosynthesis monooxygenase [Thalassotalea sp.]|nr:antibiotic biosynthesis monooxygenase [Thalassotalea sp.]MDG2394095.1 antibiotic biosynthesis monooxygenase [Thalassotalea sp.]
MFANTPKPPYYAVIFTSTLKGQDPSYESVAERMVELAQLEPGFLGIESARNEIGITVSYWRDLASIKQWKSNAEHKIAQQQGKHDWYTSYKVRICLVERDYQHI